MIEFEYDTVQYVMPKDSIMTFSITPEDTNTSVTVLDGEGTIAYRDSQNKLQLFDLPLRQEKKISLFSCTLQNYDKKCTEALHFGHDILSLQTKTKIVVRGNHSVLRAAVRNEKAYDGICLFDVQMQVDSFLFIIHEESVPLRIFTGDGTSKVVLRASLSSPRSPLAPNDEHHLLPNSCYILNSLNKKQIIFEVEGRNRVIEIPLLSENKFLNGAEAAFNHLYQLCLSSMNEKCLGPVVLILGPPNAGKTSLCHFLLSRAVDTGLNPFKVDLDIRKNSNCLPVHGHLPGSVSLLEINSHCPVSEGVKKQEKFILYFGDLDVTIFYVRFYHYLLQKIGQKMKECLKKNMTSHSLAIIDMCGPLGQDESTINCVLKSFDISMVLVVGEPSNKSCYHYMKKSLVGKAIEFIPEPEDIEPINEIFEIKSREKIFRRYFYGKDNKPEEPDFLKIKLSEVKLFRVVPVPIKDSSAFNSTVNRVINDNDFSLQPVKWSPFIEYHVLGVSKATDVEVFSSAIEIEHFVCFTKIDLTKGLGLLLSPIPGPFSGKCLIMGNVKMPAD